ncbi:exopolysaccharide Pel transporter PelG [Bacillus sp. S13(2024)]|uniref:exopolysaccharide Pel transporter PelG n=1 Tax=unclassified Bacillus (in: firmicutes) TaxID=185979 RepID=UPI003D24167A
MAGIGFRLQKLFQEDYYSSRIKAYGFSLFVTAGPWLMVILGVTAIHYVLSFFHFLSIEEQRLFTISISYCFIFSQIIYGSLQLIVTRYVADLLYEQKTDKLFASFLGMTKIILFFAIVLWGIFSILTPLPLYYKIMLLFLFLALNIIWIQSIYLTAAKDYQSIALAFLVGAVISITGIIIVSYTHPTLHLEHGSAFLLLTCFTVGTFITLGWLSVVMVKMFPKNETKDQFIFLTYLDKYPELFWAGLLYNIGIWVCNFIIWFGEGNELIAGSFLYHPLYDTSVFWAYLTIIPTYIFFVVSIETRFYKRYKNFFGTVNSGGTLNQILHQKDSMKVVLRQEVERLLRTQGIFTFLIIFGIWIYMSQSGLRSLQYSIFQLTAIGAYSNSMVLVMTLLLLYFDDRKGAFRTAALFFFANLTLTAILLPLGYNGYGLSFAIGSSIAFLYSISRIFNYVQQIDYYTFCTPTALYTKRNFFTKLANKLNKYA